MSKLCTYALLLSVSLVGCESDNDPVEQPRRPLDEEYPARITLSDSGEYYAQPQIIISGRGSADPQSGARVVVQANGTNFSKVTSTEAYREGRPDMDVGFTIDFDAAQGTALARGETVAIENGTGFGYGEPGRQVYRTVSALTLTANADHTVTLVVGLAPGITLLDPTMAPSDPNMGTAESMTVTGQIPVVCTPPPMLADDPNFTTEFCRNALDEFGLRAIREAQL